MSVKIYRNLSDIRSRNKITVTVEICIKGGIVAANGISGSFKVVPVQVVSSVSRLRRESGQSASQAFSNTKDSESFDRIFQQKLSENESLDCYTVTYGRDRQLQTYYYQPKREYTY
ncbi:MAG: hypothetical protein HFG79_15875 [Lachnospiraceae bacterium]|nr:hypothetical protein [Lachnospiraceae bacterium]